LAALYFAHQPVLWCSALRPISDTAEGVKAPIVPEARTFEQLQNNIRDVVAVDSRGGDCVTGFS
jgi:hypothetical protein